MIKERWGYETPGQLDTLTEIINDLRIFKEMIKERWGYETPGQLDTKMKGG